ncbi:MAG: hypothetical protein J3K34DRAFT_447858 [Monoraphidium minutum]|nr:MAG: hypothetical protein J3K34DRAFT_447858 [Monoraphidium minutum]
MQFITAPFTPPGSAELSCCTLASTVPLGCGVGKELVDDGYSPCTPCTGNYVQSSVAMIAQSGSLGRCTPCPAGTAANKDKSACLDACAPGTGGPQCSPCDMGMWSSGSTEAGVTPDCVPCGNGLTTMGTGATRADDCQVPICKPGTAGPNCTASPKGHYSHGGNMSAPWGAWSGDIKSSSTVGTKCPSGFTTPGTGATSAKDCKVHICGPGTAGPFCAMCPYGRFSLGGTLSEPWSTCQSCPPGMYTTIAGARSKASCYKAAAPACAAGFIRGDGACHLCPRGSFSPGGGALECQQCPPGTTTKDPGSGHIDACFVPSGEL